MNVLITTSGKILKTPDGRYWSKMIYGYSFYLDYLKVFDEITVFSQVRYVNELDEKEYLLVSGINLNIVELEYSHGIVDFLTKRNRIFKQIKSRIDCCDCAIVRPPDQISNFIISYMMNRNKPVAIEVTTDVWQYLAPGNNSSPARSFLRCLWTYEQKKNCSRVEGAAYVSNYLRQMYPSRHALHPHDPDAFDEVFTDAGLIEEYYQDDFKQYTDPIEHVELIHVAANLGNDAKGYAELIEAAAMLRNDYKSVKVTVIGDGDFSRSTKKLIRKLNMENCINKTGKISDRKIIFQFLRDADIFVFPSYSEGMPRTLLEAMVCGCVCITSNLPACCEVLSKNAVVPVRDSQKLYVKLKEYLCDYYRMNLEKVRNYEKAKEYSAKNVQKKRNEFYCRLYNEAKTRML